MKRREGKRPLALKIGIAILITIAVVVIFAPLIAPYDPLEQIPKDRLQSPSLSHILGTDAYGRDIFSRILYGGRTTLSASLLALCSTLFLGIFVGLVAGYFGGIVDTIITHMVDVLMSFPFIVLAMIITAFFGTGFVHLLIAIVMVWWIPFARLSRSIALETKNNPEVLSAFVLGAKKSTIIIRELFPSVISPNVVLSTFQLGDLILTISALSFFGLGAKPPSPEWGGMLADGKAHFFQAPYIIWGPTLFIFLTVLALNLIGEGLRDLWDPYEIPKIK